MTAPRTVAPATSNDVGALSPRGGSPPAHPAGGAPDDLPWGARARPGSEAPLALVPVRCCLCGATDATPLATGEDFEYHTSPDAFLAVRCADCGLVYLNPRPAPSELDRIYPPDYHAYVFSEERFGFTYRVRRRLEGRRALGWTRGLPPDARILDVGCGDGFHLRLLGEFGAPGWRLEGVDPSTRAVRAARAAGLTVHHGRVEELSLPRDHYDLVLLIATVEHVDDPAALLRTVRGLLRPSGRAVVITDNAATLDFRLFGARHWGGYHFPRHFTLFDRRTLAVLARTCGLAVDSMGTQVSPINWVYSVRNALDDYGAPRWLVERFDMRAPLGLALFTAVDAACAAAGHGALLRAELRRPREDA
ncbi:MAG TPA: class I SAM-dependent methyltransferase [Gemmatimonadaceae bacterium]|nr:class I SAM-dependent methyltransferase [Gemmatimonadaceae bacterium]